MKTKITILITKTTDIRMEDYEEALTPLDAIKQDLRAVKNNDMGLMEFFEYLDIKLENLIAVDAE